MLRVFTDIAQAATCQSFRDLRGFPLHRGVSTNAAIHRGIRRSKDGSHGDRTYPRARDIRGREFDSKRPSQDAAPARVRRPNHQQRQDVEDMEESAKIKEGRLTPKQQRYLRGGSRDVPDRSQRFSSARPFRRAENGDEPFHRRPERTGRYEAGRRPTYTSAPSNRQEYAGQRLSPRSDEVSHYAQIHPQKERHEAYHQARERHPPRLQREDRVMGRRSSYEEEDNTPLRGHKSEQTRFDSVDRPRRDLKTPLSIPYTTPASEFLYGTSVITAALKSSRRKLYKLYMYDGENREVQEQDASVRKLALVRGVVVTQVKRDWLRLMDKMSGGRPHNGYILEASPLPKLPITGFKKVDRPQDVFHVVLDHQSREDEAVNGTDSSVKYTASFPRYPFVLMLDGILDPGNLGAILRSAYFLGVDAVAISNRNSAPFTPVTLKASAGATESLPLMSISQPGALIDEAQKNGWKFYAGVAPGLDAKKPRYFSTSTLQCPAKDHPCVLMLGGEGEGLRWNLQKKADYVIGVEGDRIGQGGVDSLNVSVAAGLLCEAFLRKPAGPLKDARPDLSGGAEIPEPSSRRAGSLF